MPAEWEQHAATLLAWPKRSATWVDDHRLRRVEAVYRQIVKGIGDSEPVIVLVADEAVEKRARERLSSVFTVFPVRFVRLPYNDTWARDYGPIVVRDAAGQFVFGDWGFNAWGGKYPPWDDDDAVPVRLAEILGVPSEPMPLILEGGSIDVNGQGLLLTTESVLLTPTRNPRYSKPEIEAILKARLGLTDIIWLKNGLAGDDTDGHIDDLSRFVDADTVVTLVTDDRQSPNYEALAENEALLRAYRRPDGSPLKIVPVPMPETVVDDALRDGSSHVPASYANFLITNRAVLLPVYDERFDQQVIRLFERLFPGRRIVPVPCADLVWGQGSIHCITQQLYGIRV